VINLVQASPVKIAEVPTLLQISNLSDAEKQKLRAARFMSQAVSSTDALG